MLGSEKDYFRHHIVEVGRAERSGESYFRMLVIAGAHKIDVTLTIDLPAREEKYVNAALAGTVEQLARTIGEKIVLAALQQRYIRPSFAAFACQQCRGRRDGRSIADGDVVYVADQTRDHVGE